MPYFFSNSQSFLAEKASYNICHLTSGGPVSHKRLFRAQKTGSGRAIPLFCQIAQPHLIFSSTSYTDGLFPQCFFVPVKSFGLVKMVFQLQMI